MATHKIENLSGLALNYVAAMALKQMDLMDFELVDHDGFFRIHDKADNQVFDQHNPVAIKKILNIIEDQKIGLLPIESYVDGERATKWLSGKDDLEIKTNPFVGDTLLESGLRSFSASILGNEIEINDDIARNLFPNDVNQIVYHVTTLKSLELLKNFGYLASQSVWIADEEMAIRDFHLMEEMLDAMDGGSTAIVLTANLADMYAHRIEPFNEFDEIDDELMTDEQREFNREKKSSFELTGKTWKDALEVFGTVKYQGLIPRDSLKFIPNFEVKSHYAPKP